MKNNIHLLYLSASTKTILNHHGINDWEDIDDIKKLDDLKGIGEKRKQEIIEASKKYLENKDVEVGVDMAKGKSRSYYQIIWYENYSEQSMVVEDGFFEKNADLKWLVNDLEAGDGVTVEIKKIKKETYEKKVQSN